MNHSVAGKYSAGKIIALVIAFALHGTVLGEELQDVKALLQEGKLTEAMVKTNKLMESRPADPAVQFVKGLILSEQKKTGEAIETFSKLTLEHPDLPEPYNNLGVLFAANGQFEKARVALETALKLNPKYATARENLGDLYLQAALQSYSDLARDEGESKGLKAKLKGVRGTLGLPLNGPAAQSKNASASLASAETRNPANAASNKQFPQQEREVVLKVVDQWVRAWSAKDLKTYFLFYSDDFRPPQGETRAQWESERRLRIGNKNQIDIQVLSPSVTIEGNNAVVNFQQIYVAGKISSNVQKSLTLKNEAGTWKILQEKSDG
jgi:tetratricopeptide (TPR) repeat protein